MDAVKGRTWRRPAGASRLGVNFVGPLEALHGLGVSARGYAAAVRCTGRSIHEICWRSGFDRVRHAPYEARQDGLQPINLIHLNFDLLQSAGMSDGPLLSELITSERYNIAIVSWELISVPRAWTPIMERFDEIWVGSRFTQRAFEAVYARPVRLVRPGLAPRLRRTRATQRSSPRSNTFFYSADLGSVPQRKNPEALWTAYAEAFGPRDGAACILKLHYPHEEVTLVERLRSVGAARRDMRLVTGTLSEERMGGLYEAVDFYVSPHRSEGVGLTIVEAMQAGKPVVATGYGGPVDFVTPDTAIVLPHSLVEVGPQAAPYPSGSIWAEPDQAALVSALQALANDPEGAAERAKVARNRVDLLFGVLNSAAVIEDELQRILASSAPGQPEIA